FGGLSKRRIVRNQTIFDVAHAAARNEMFNGRLFHFKILDISRKNDHGGPTVRFGHADSLINNQLGMHRRRHGLHKNGDVAENTLEIDLLLELTAQRDSTLLSDNSHNWCVITLSIV